MTPQGHKYFQMFMATNQQRINDSLAQARREMETARMDEVYMRNYLLGELAREKQNLVGMQGAFTAARSGRGGGGGSMSLDKMHRAYMNQHNNVQKYGEAREKGRNAALQAYDVSGTTFNNAYLEAKNKHVPSYPGVETSYDDYNVRMENFVFPEVDVTAKGLDTEQKRQQAASIMAQDLVANGNVTEEQALINIGEQFGWSREELRSSEELAQDKLQAKLVADEMLGGQGNLETGAAILEGMLKGGGGGRGARGPSTPQKMLMANTQSRIDKIEDQLENLALDPVRMEDIRRRAGEIHAPYMGKKEREVIEAAQTVRAMNLPDWQKSFLQSGRRSHEYGNMTADEVFDKGQSERHGMQMADMILSGDMTLEEAMGRISQYEDKAEQERMIAAMASVGIRKANAQKPKPVKGERKLVRELEKATKEAMSLDLRGLEDRRQVSDNPDWYADLDAAVARMNPEEEERFFIDRMEMEIEEDERMKNWPYPLSTRRHPPSVPFAELPYTPGLPYMKGNK